jgi:hypothetical protein
MDVFKYFKQVRSLQESRGAEKAAELGYQHQARGVYLDPQTGNRYKAVGDKLEPYDLPDRMANSPGAQAAEPEKDRTLSDFRKDAPRPEQPQEVLPVADQMSRNVPGGPTTAAVVSGDIEQIEKGMMRGRGKVMSSTRKAQVKQQAEYEAKQAREILGQLAAEREEEELAQADAEAENYRNVDEVIADNQTQEELDSLLDTVGLGKDTPERIEYLSQQEQPELTEVQMQNEDERRQVIIDTLEMMMTQPEKKKGAGANKLSRDDAELLKTYIEGNGPKIDRLEISDEDMAFAKDYLKKNHKGAFTKLALGTKGAPKERYDGRGDAVLKSYLANRGLSAVSGKPLSYFASELDHITSLGNGGVDGFENWAWVDKRYNQFMSSLDDEGVLKKIEKLANANPDDERLKELKGELTNEVRNRYGTYFRTNGTVGVSLEDIEEAKGIGGEQMLKALASAAGVNTYKGSEDRTRARGRFIGYPNLKQALIEKLNPATREEMEEFDESLNEIRDFIEEKNKEMEPFTKKGRKKAAKTKMEEAHDHWSKLQKPGRIVFETLRRSLRDPLS